MVFRVGKNYNGKEFSYSDCKADLQGWIKTSEFMPDDYDILELKDAKENIKFGWSTGHKWDGCKIKEKDEFFYWKRKKDIFP